MKHLKPIQIEDKQTLSVRLPKTLAAELEAYAKYLNSGRGARGDIITKYLRDAIDSDAAFQEWRKEQQPKAIGQCAD